MNPTQRIKCLTTPFARCFWPLNTKWGQNVPKLPHCILKTRVHIISNILKSPLPVTLNARNRNQTFRAKHITTISIVSINYTFQVHFYNCKVKFQSQSEPTQCHKYAYTILAKRKWYLMVILWKYSHYCISILFLAFFWLYFMSFLLLGYHLIKNCILLGLHW